MKREREIESYFKTKTEASDAGDERRSSIRRVSFAADPPMVYPANKEEQKKQDSSTMSMEIEEKAETEAVEEEIVEESMQENETLPLCEEEREENFIMEDSDESADEKRMSICPSDQKTMEHTGIVELDKPQEIPAYESAAGTGKTEKAKKESASITAQSSENLKSESDVERMISVDREEAEMHEYTIGAVEEKEEIVSDMLSDIMCAGESNTLIYDTLNVEEVLSKYEISKKEEAKKIREALEEMGIRFLDNLSLMKRRRETLSKVKNSVPEELFIYYGEYLAKRIGKQSEFSTGLAVETERLRGEIEGLEREVECGKLLAMDRSALAAKLRQVKSDARREGKQRWHQKRLEHETAFAAEASRTLHMLEKELQGLEEEIGAKTAQIQDTEIRDLEKKEKMIRDALSKLGNMSEKDVTAFMKETKECKEVLEREEAEYEAAARELARLEAEGLKLEQEIEEEERALSGVQENLSAVEVQREDLDRAKESVQRMEEVFGVRVIEMLHSRLLFSLCGLVITVIYDNTSVVDLYAETKEKSLFKEYLAASVGRIRGAVGALTESVPAIARYVLEMHAVEKEIEQLGVQTPYKMRRTENELVVEFMVKKGKQEKMGHVTVKFSPGDTVPEIRCNIKGHTVDKNVRYGSVTRAVESARKFAHVA